MPNSGSTSLRTSSEATETPKYLVFQLGDELFGMDVMNVREITVMYPVTEAPYLESSIRGLINLRGKIVPVVDLRTRFGLPERSADSRTSTIVVDVDMGRGPTLVGLIVDSVLEVAQIPPSAIEEPPQFPGGDSPPWILGLAKMGGNVTILLKIDQALLPMDDALRQLERARQSAGPGQSLRGAS
ncbi:MAG: chemotaxis protein CheW [Acidobacteria bacterium]|nr:chemotaxis protein CheW [Acidobacteriota bacterium]